MTKTPAQILRDAKAHISDPSMWIRDKLFDGIDPDDSTPCCAIGAIVYVSYQDRNEWGSKLKAEDTAREFANRSAREMGYCNVLHINDNPTTTHQDIMVLFDRAIEIAEATQ